MSSFTLEIIGFVLIILVPMLREFWREDLDLRYEWNWLKDSLICAALLIMYFTSVICFILALVKDIETHKPLEPYKTEIVKSGETIDTTYHYSLFK